MKIVKVKTHPPYEILIEEGIFNRLSKELKSNFNFGKIAIITDTTVEKLWGEKLLEDLKKEKIESYMFSFPPGESSKTMNTVISLARGLLEKNFDRKDLIIALGGGVVGDVAGFLASIYLRGIPFIQIPTTLLAQVDASVGGKTGVDLPEGKNLLGTFYQPLKVYIDPLFLHTLPLKEVQNGLVEVIKYGCILKNKLFTFLKKKGQNIYHLESQDLEYIIYESCFLKAYVVSKDEKESGFRRILNFGHTLGHALETELNYTIPHGIAVGLGILAEALISEKLKVAEIRLFEPIKELFSHLNLPYKFSHLSLEINLENLLQHLSKDKKVWKGKLTIVLLKRIGKAIFYENPPLEIIKEVLYLLN
ncbi:MAG: 3-dehydroquinate synthase [Thermodesulfobacterium sp.]|nr:3-dehydroquinate synthase [Thermodesulfobacterium sp.]